MTDFFITDQDTDNLITTYSQWLQAQDIEEPENGYSEEQEKESDLVDEILSLDAAHWFFRRASGGAFDGGNSDTINRLRSRAIKQYEEIMGKPYVDLNEDKTW